MNVTSLLEPKYDESYGAQPIPEPEEGGEYYDTNYQGDYVQNDGFNELDVPVEGYEEMAQMDGANYGGHGHIPNGQMMPMPMPMPNGQMHGQMPNGQMLHYQPQGVQSEGQARPCDSCDILFDICFMIIMMNRHTRMAYI